MIKAMLTKFWHQFSFWMIIIYQKLVLLLFRREETPYTILQITDTDKYSTIRRAYRKQLFRYKSTIDKDYSDMTRKILEAYEVIKRKESIYIGDSYFDENFYKRTGECFSNLEMKRIIVDENNIRDVYSRFRMKYRELVKFLKQKEMTLLMPKAHYVKTEYKPVKKTKVKKEKTYKCTVCKKDYQQKTKYIEHMNGNKHRNKCRELGVELNIPDEICPQVKESRERGKSPKKECEEEHARIEKRKVNTMTGTGTFVEPHHFLFCSLCDKKFPNRKELTLHLQKH
ncbi:putative Heat shock protein DnaJ,  Zinc finger, C2H2-like protein [Trachipleistophora hominis]|uniref:Putative Heat shock protein DnaJ, Zinc finger, C2H2-like protein n=1 Tax=Trachipleistophora hominis TaxID=72359 RepID=L7K048_TRAHO|nr:putative Heat shock protein DnaJ,  Zinc finger, C2H2-like protein [Trachipleistophora hominis]